VKLSDLAVRLRCRLEGDGAIDIVRVASLDTAGPGDVTFLSNPKYASKLATTRASAVIVNDAVEHAPCAMLRTSQVYVAFAEALEVLSAAPRPSPGISGLASIDPAARIGPDVFVGPFVVVGPGASIGARTVLHSHVVIGAGAEIGNDCLLHARVSVREGVVLGHRVVMQDGAVVGSDGFGFAKRPDGTHQKIPQVGRVVVEDDVEIGANSTIDRPAVGETRIASGTKIDNLVHIAHGVQIGHNVLLAALVGIAGSTVIEDDVVLAGQVGVINHIRVGKGVVANAKSALMGDIPAGLHISGIPAGDVNVWRKSAAIVRRLPELRERIARLDERLDALEAQIKKPEDRVR
jgi:UDP-3-O-[3-hydroxymyristoyl] glucosamine N-acyltransferase